MTRSLRTWQALLLPLLCMLLWGLPAQSAHATVTCPVTIPATVSFGNVDLVNGVNLTTSATLTYTCSNTSTSAQFVNVCFNVGNGAQGGSNISPRIMTSGANALQFQLYAPTASTIWGNATAPTQYIVQLSVPKKTGAVNGTSGPFTVAVQGALVIGQTVSPGTYSNAFTGTNTSITLKSNKTSMPATCGTKSSGTFPFTVNATVIKSCTVTANSNINLGSVSSTAVNTSSSNTISVACTRTTPYYVGLLPSAANGGTALGTGNMVTADALAGNTDKVPYKLYSNAGLSTVWGNTATSTSVGNGVAGTGTGLALSIPVYAKAPSANFTPDSYSDIVTVNVNY